jgi:hypothetical protein
MGNKKTKEQLPLLPDHYYEFAVYDNPELYDTISRIYNVVDSYTEYDRDVKLLRYSDKMVKMISVDIDSKEYISRRAIPVIVTHKSYNRMSEYNVKDMIRLCGDNVVIVHIASMDILNLCETNIEQYLLTPHNMRDITDIILDKHVI